MRLIDADELTIHFRRAIKTFLPNDSTRHMKTEDALICKGWQDGLMVIQDAPTIKPKKGKWIHHPEWEDDGDRGYECSECHMGSDVDYNFCMRCGADMRGEQDDT